ncbi:15139_t:CDS:1 [Funneliformis geosporum]|nr:15139_t:CDS:1 [Funneliformis geosporum]
MPTFQVLESINNQINKAITPLQIPLYQQLTSNLFIIKTIFKLYNVKLNNSKIIIPEEYLQIGSNLAKNIKKFHLEFNNKKQILESTNSLNEYQSALPKSL